MLWQDREEPMINKHKTVENLCHIYPLPFNVNKIILDGHATFRRALRVSNCQTGRVMRFDCSRSQTGADACYTF